MNYIDWLLYVELIFHSWDKCFFKFELWSSVLSYTVGFSLQIFCWFLLFYFCFYVHDMCWFGVFFPGNYFVWLWYKDNPGLIKFHCFLFSIRVLQNSYYFFFNILVEFTSEAKLGPQVFFVGRRLTTYSVTFIVIGYLFLLNEFW